MTTISFGALAGGVNGAGSFAESGAESSASAIATREACRFIGDLRAIYLTPRELCPWCA